MFDYTFLSDSMFITLFPYPPIVPLSQEGTAKVTNFGEQYQKDCVKILLNETLTIFNKENLFMSLSLFNFAFYFKFILFVYD